MGLAQFDRASGSLGTEYTKRNIHLHWYQYRKPALLRQYKSFMSNRKTEVGYRLYDESALERLQQILYFRELDFPLKLIKEIIKNPTLVYAT